MPEWTHGASCCLARGPDVTLHLRFSCCLLTSYCSSGFVADSECVAMFVLVAMLVFKNTFFVLMHLSGSKLVFCCFVVFFLLFCFLPSGRVTTFVVFLSLPSL